jgi:type I restriction enzyme S subunit
MITEEKQNSWHMNRLIDVCDINPTKKEIEDVNDNTEVSFLPMAGVSEDGILLSMQKKKLKEVRKGFTYFRDGDVLFAKITPCMENGKRWLANSLINGIGFGSTEFHVLRSNSEVTSEWLYYFISRQNFRDEAEKNMTGTAGQKRVPRQFLENLMLLVPPVEVQKRLTESLTKMDKLRQKRDHANQTANKLLQAVFLQMFGDPQTNPKKWELKTLPEIVAKDKYSIKRGPFGGSLKKKFFTTTGFLVYEQFHAINNDFSKNRYFIDEAKYKELEMFKVVEGDLIISCSGVTLGRIAEVPKGALSGIINQALLKVSLDKSKMNSKYFMFLFRGKTIQETLFRLSRGSGQPNLPPVPEIKAIKFMAPPIDLQNDFLSIVEKIENIMKKQGCSTNEINQLFDSLMSKAFKGKLNLETVD